jgi:hypothetical protein
LFSISVETKKHAIQQELNKILYKKQWYMISALYKIYRRQSICSDSQLPVIKKNSSSRPKIPYDFQMVDPCRTLLLHVVNVYAATLFGTTCVLLCQKRLYSKYSCIPKVDLPLENSGKQHHCINPISPL